MDSDRIRAAIDEAVDALQTAVLLVAQIEAEQHHLRHTIDRAARALVVLTPTKDPDASEP